VSTNSHFCDVYPDDYSCLPRPSLGPSNSPTIPQLPDSTTQVGAIDDHAGKVNGMKTLFSIASGKIKQIETCKKFFAALAEGTRFDGNTLMDAVVKAALNTASGGYVYDGPSSNTVLTQEAFPDTASPGITTVGQWFGAGNDRQALSQFNGSAIWIRFDDWADGMLFSSSFSGGYNIGTMLHELLHKQAVNGGFDHARMENALAKAGFDVSDRAFGRNGISDGLGRLCN
jgi:hypothetical protein